MSAANPVTLPLADYKARSIHLAVDGKVATITLDRPDKKNPLTFDSYAEIVDLTEVEDLDLRADEFLKLADEVDPFSPDAKRAFIVRNSVQNHAARMHKVLRTQRNIEIFRSIEEAERWITK